VSEFSIELASERIVDAHTKEYFKEVQQSYSAGNYRSAVVMLWSVVVCDLLFKLTELRDMYADLTAASILQTINDKRGKNPYSSDWEKELLEQVKDRTDLLDDPEHDSLVLLHSHRHLCAHPALNSLNVLYQPTPEECRAHLRVALDAVLTKPPVMTKKVFDVLLEDLKRFKDLLPDDGQLARYLNARYFSHLTPAVHVHLFKSLWHVVLRVTDEECDANRKVNARALERFYLHREDTCLGAIEKDRDYYSDVAGTPGILRVLNSFLSHHPRIFQYLTDSVKPLLESLWKTDIDALSSAWYESSDPSIHADRVAEEMKSRHKALSEAAYEEFALNCDQNSLVAQANEAAVLDYTLASCFDTADLAFARILKPRLSTLSSKELAELLSGIEGNDQTYNRNRAWEDHLLIQERIEQVIGPDFDATAYPHFTTTVKNGQVMLEARRHNEKLFQGVG
jgi:hypothetical protein